MPRINQLATSPSSIAPTDLLNAQQVAMLHGRDPVLIPVSAVLEPNRAYHLDSSYNLTLPTITPALNGSTIVVYQMNNTSVVSYTRPNGVVSTATIEGSLLKPVWMLFKAVYSTDADKCGWYIQGNAATDTVVVYLTDANPDFVLPAPVAGARYQFLKPKDVTVSVSVAAHAGTVDLGPVTPGGTLVCPVSEEYTDWASLELYGVDSTTWATVNLHGPWETHYYMPELTFWIFLQTADASGLYPAEFYLTLNDVMYCLLQQESTVEAACTASWIYSAGGSTTKYYPGIISSRGTAGFTFYDASNDRYIQNDANYGNLTVNESFVYPPPYLNEPNIFKLEAYVAQHIDWIDAHGACAAFITHIDGREVLAYNGVPVSYNGVAGRAFPTGHDDWVFPSSSAISSNELYTGEVASFAWRAGKTFDLSLFTLAD